MKFVIAVLLLLTAVPAGCLPLMTAGAIVDEVRISRQKNVMRRSDAAQIAYVFVTIMATLAVATSFAFNRILRRTGRLGGDDDWLGLGRRSWRVLLWTSFVLGVACGVSMIVTA